VSGFGVMAGQVGKITRSGFLPDICIPKYYVPNLSDSNHIFRAEARDIG
jgi:hypothetical protein